MLVLSTRAAQATPAEAGALEALAAAIGEETLGGDPRPLLTSPSDDLACRDLVRLVSDFLDGDLPPDWRASIDAHLRACDGCTSYLEQIRQTVALLEQIDATQHPAPTKASGAAGQPGTAQEPTSDLTTAHRAGTADAGIEELPATARRQLGGTHNMTQAMATSPALPPTMLHCPERRGPAGAEVAQGIPEPVPRGDRAAGRSTRTQSTSWSATTPRDGPAPPTRLPPGPAGTCAWP